MKNSDTKHDGDAHAAKTMARRLIEHHFKSKPLRVTYQAEGLTNFVFIVKHTEGDFVVRIGNNPSKINAYIKEQWAVGKAREAGVPTTEILEVGNEVIPSPYMISRQARGHAATHHPARLTILREMGRYAAIVNSIETSGFGGVFDWSNNQLSHNETWSDFLHQELQIEARLEILKANKMLPSATIKELGEILEKGAGKKPATALNHGDVRLKNVLVENTGKITALLDWEHSMSNVVPHWELSLALHDLSIDEKVEFLAGYGVSDDEIRSIAPLMKALNIINYVPHIEKRVKSGDEAGLEKFRLRLSGALDLYSL